MRNKNVEKAKADVKKGMADIGNKMAYAKADAKADVEKVKANFGHSVAEKKEAYAKADIKAAAEKGIDRCSGEEEVSIDAGGDLGLKNFLGRPGVR